MKIVILTEDMVVNGRMRVKGEVISTSEDIGQTLRENAEIENLIKTKFYEGKNYETPKNKLSNKT